MRKIIAISQDDYWLKAIHAAVAGLGKVQIASCDDSLRECLDRLPAVDPQALLLVDVFSKENIDKIVSGLYQAGWRFIVVVAADPSLKEAIRVIKAQGFDYWKKTYTIPDIETEIRKCLEEIAGVMERAGSSE